MTANTNTPAQLADDRAVFARTGAWSIDLNNCLQIIALIKHANIPTNAAQELSISYADGNSQTILFSEAICRHLREHLCTKTAAIFAKRGDANTLPMKEMADNDLITRWKPQMDKHAAKAGVDTDRAKRLVDKLLIERHNLVTHRGGSFASPAHESNGSSVTFRANLIPLETAELDLLDGYLNACKDFVDHAKLRNGVPTFPFDITKAKFDARGRYWN
jgi:hypothetical protein